MTRTLDLLDRLIAFPTVSQCSNLELINWARSILSEAGFTVSLIPAVGGEKAGLVARLGPDIPGGICLSGHTDVVPSDGQSWTRDPFKLTRDGGRVFGRGTTDMKGFVASALALAERAKGVELAAPLCIVLSYDEEIGCVGIREMLPAVTPLIGAPDLVIVGEPTSMQVGIGHKGKAALRVICKGQAGHSALAPDFINALHVATDFISEMRALQDAYRLGVQDPAYDIPYSTVHVGTLSGGQALNIVPDRATLDMEFRHLAQAPAADIVLAIEAAAKRVCAAFGQPDLIEIEQINAYPGLNQADQSRHVAQAQSLAGGTVTTKVAFGTEAGYFADMDLNAVVVGPGSMARDGHKADEGLDVAELAACDAMMDRVLSSLTT